MGLLEDINSGKNNLVIIVIGIVFIFHLYWSRPNNVEKMADTNMSDQVRDAVKQYYLADVEAIRNLSEVATKLQSGGITNPGNLTVKGQLASGEFVSTTNKTNEGGRIRILNELKNGQKDQTNDWSIWNMTGNYGNKLAFWRFNGDGKNAGPALEIYDNGHHNITHTGDHVLHVNGDTGNPYISLGRTGTWDKKKLYIQNINPDTENPMFRVGVHGDRVLMDMNKAEGVKWQRKDGKWTQFDHTDGNNYIRGNTNQEGNLVINGTTTMNGNTTINGTLANKVNIIYPVKWDRQHWLDLMTPYFSNNDPDGTKRDFILIHPGDFNVNHPNRWIVYEVGVKIGKQILYFQHQPEHHEIPNPYTNSANDINWRRNV